MFSTHYHELTVLDKKLKRLKNVHVSAHEENGNVTFLHKIKEGSIDKSYGLHVAKLAKLPEALLSRADEITLDFIKSHQKESGIIYCFSRKKVDELTTLLQSQGYSALPYHAGLNDTTRSQNQSDFIKDNVKIIVATLAFGMGINKPNVRYVIHYDLPKSIEQYYQEIGRAGRDGLQSTALLLYSYGDF